MKPGAWQATHMAVASLPGVSCYCAGSVAKERLAYTRAMATVNQAVLPTILSLVDNSLADTGTKKKSAWVGSAVRRPELRMRCHSRV